MYLHKNVAVPTSKQSDKNEVKPLTFKKAILYIPMILYIIDYFFKLPLDGMPQKF
jgi:hypothetical protein